MAENKNGFIYQIGDEYHYLNDTKVFKLKSVSDEPRPVFYFECGHCCTSCVFEDLKPINKQIGLF